MLEDSGFSNVKVTTRTLVTRYPASGEWLNQFVTGAGATIAVLREMSGADKDHLQMTVARDVANIYRSHVDGDVVAVPMTAHIGSGEA